MASVVVWVPVSVARAVWVPASAQVWASARVWARGSARLPPAQEPASGTRSAAWTTLASMLSRTRPSSSWSDGSDRPPAPRSASVSKQWPGRPSTPTSTPHRTSTAAPQEEGPARRSWRSLGSAGTAAGRARPRPARRSRRRPRRRRCRASSAPSVRPHAPPDAGRAARPRVSRSPFVCTRSVSHSHPCGGITGWRPVRGAGPTRAPRPSRVRPCSIRPDDRLSGPERPTC